MLKLKAALLDSLVERLVFLAANEECEAIQEAYIKELGRVDRMRADARIADSRTQGVRAVNTALG